MLDKLTKNLLPVAIVIAAVIIGGVLVYTNQVKINKANQEVLASQAAGEKAIDYINKNLLSGGVTASLVSTVEENGLYKIKIKIQDKEYDSYITKDGGLFFPEGISLEETVGTQSGESQEEKKVTIGNFSAGEDEICKEEGKPIIYFFGSTSCPHCAWEHPIIEKVAKSFEGYISFHNNMDANTDMDIFKKYSTGGIPTLVFGCKYYRVGSGEGEGEELESKNLTAIICKLTNAQPSETCDRVKDLIDQIVE